MLTNLFSTKANKKKKLVGKKRKMKNFFHQSEEFFRFQNKTKVEILRIFDDFLDRVGPAKETSQKKEK